MAVFGQYPAPNWGIIPEGALHDSSEAESGGRRRWQHGDRAKVSIMQVFRASFQDHDARKAAESRSADGHEITRRSRMRREGVTETALRSYLEIDLNALFNTTRLDAATSLDDAPHVSRSILNYGFRDLSGVLASSLRKPEIIDSIRQSLINHEPRLVPESIRVEFGKKEAETRHRLALTISAELLGDPVDVPLDFDAEIDLGAGKMKVSKLRVQM